MHVKFFLAEMKAKWHKVEKEYYWAITQMAGLSCCGRSGYIVLELGC
jgi:hypothetical protein